MRSKKERRPVAPGRRPALLSQASTILNDKSTKIRRQRRHSPALAGILCDDEYMVGIDPDSTRIEVGPWPDDTGWSRSYPITFGCNYAEPLRGTVMDNRRAALRWGANPRQVEREFSKLLGHEHEF